jgi:ribose/xylose/arabinose/galactoside ABC-type transport system permease subunit
MTGLPQRIIQSDHLVLALCAAYFCAVAPFAEGFATRENLGNVLSAMMPLLVVAVGQTVVLITAGIDLSATAVIGLASVTGAMVVNAETGPLGGSALATPAAVAVMLGVGAAVGLLNGALISKLKMPPFIVTLTAMMFFSGLAVWMVKSKPITGLPAGFMAIGKNVWLAGAVALGVAAAAHIMLRRTLLGRWIYASGQNPQAALVSGVPVGRVVLLAYVVSGLCAGVAAALITGRLESGSPVHWKSNLLDIIGAAVIGGASLRGGRGTVAWTVFGVLFLTLIDNSLNLLDLSHFTIMMVKGGIILAAAALDSLRNRLLGAAN